MFQSVLFRPLLSVGIFFSFAAGMVQAEVNLQPFTAQYAGEKKIALFTVKANLDLALRRQGDYLIYTSDTLIKWSFYERNFYDCSVIKIDDEKLYPIEYQHIDKGNSKYNVHANFDWENNTAITREEKEPGPETTEITWPTWDPMSFQVAIMAAAPNQAAGSVQSHQVLEKGRLRDYTLHFKGKVDVETEVPDITVHEIFSQKKSGDGAFWLTPEHFWAPAKIRIDDVIIDLQALPEKLSADESDATEHSDVPSC